MVFLIVLIVIAIALLPFSLFTVQTQSNAIIERFGRFNRVARPGLNIKIPLIDQKVGTVSFRISQLDLNVETKTRDNVFVMVHVSIQYTALENKVYDAWYRLKDPQTQIAGYVFDAVRSTVPGQLLDEAFEHKDEIARAVAGALSREMDEFGYRIVKTLVTDINPDERVKASMNNINAAQRERVAAQELAEADRIRVVTNARAQAEAKKLQGEGIANERKEIIEGLRSSLHQLKEEGINDDDVTRLLLLSQYFDTLSALGNKGATTILLPGSPGGVGQFSEEIRNAIITGVETTKPASPFHSSPQTPGTSN